MAMCSLIGGGVFKSAISYIKNFFFKGEHYYSWPLWFLLSIIYSSILIYLLKKILKNKIKEYHILILSILIFSFANFLLKNIDSMNGTLFSLAKIVKLAIGNGRLLTGFMYFSFGMCIAKYEIKFDLLKTFITVIIMFILTYITKYEIFRVTLYVSIFVAILSIHLKDKNIYKVLRKFSTIMYFTHMIFFFIYTLIVGKNNCYGIIGFVFTLLFTIILSIVVVKLDSKGNKLLKELF